MPREIHAQYANDCQYRLEGAGVIIQGATLTKESAAWPWGAPTQSYDTHLEYGAAIAPSSSTAIFRGWRRQQPLSTTRAGARTILSPDDELVGRYRWRVALQVS